MRLRKHPKSPKQKGNAWFFLIFLAGFLIASYSLVSQYYYRIEANHQVQEFDQSVSQLDKKDIERRLTLARAFNATLKPMNFSDPFSKKEKEEGVKAYAQMLQVKEKIGYVEIPRIQQSIPIYAGTSDEVLQKGAGHLEGTSLPVGGESTHTVISAHRGLPTAKLFRQLNKLKSGDIFYIHVLDQVLAYQVQKSQVVEPSNFDPILIQKGKDLTTLLTCTPYMINSHRLLVQGKRIPYQAPIRERAIQVQEAKRYYSYLLIAAALVIALLLWIIRKQWRSLKALTSTEKETHA
ncbi:class C sortase [Streptococcus pyogenes]|uniref:class C sortase n=1 Tax=Streptococcus pyogenes TaxID=1314 RepID=UPI0010A1E613|nr:class C sortase [Streptococcus pyogenes]VHA84488.1 sortase [Streptococcus pyogenes]VHB73383.1 sortase [Streptococcus pyogenes]VHD25189.1 sortase [Streptococcus pyogenes]